MEVNEAEAVICRSYTYARRYPLVIGKVAGWTLPSPLSITQAVTLTGSLLVLLQTRRAWAHLPGMGDLAVLVTLPLSLSWMVRHLRIEGRPPLRTLISACGYLLAPRGGVLHGRPHRQPRPARLACTRVFVVDDGVDDVDDDVDAPSRLAGTSPSVPPGRGWLAGGPGDELSDEPGDARGHQAQRRPSGGAARGGATGGATRMVTSPAAPTAAPTAAPAGPASVGPVPGSA